MSRYFPNNSLIVFKSICTILLIIYLVQYGVLDVHSIITTRVTIFSVFFIFTLLAFFSFFQVVRWYYLIKAQHITVSFSRCFSLYMISQFFTSFLPGLAGGDVVRSIYLTSIKSVSKTASISTIIIDRILGIYSLLIVGSVAFIIFVFDNASLPLQAVAIGKVLLGLSIVSTFCIILVLYNPYIVKKSLFLFGESFQHNFESVRLLYLLNARFLLVAVISSFLSSMMFVWAFYFVGSLLSDHLTILQSALTIPVIVISNLVPLTPGGLGIGETTSDYLLQIFQVTAGAEIMLTLRLWILITRLPGGILFITTKRH